MPEHIRIIPPADPIKVDIKLPRSKSISNRLLVMAALSGSRHLLEELSDADDTGRLDHLVNERPLVMDCGAGGTTLRFLLAWAAIQEGEERLISGTPRLMDRPHDDLVRALRQLGASIDRVEQGFRVIGKKLQGGTVEFLSPISSQYISALLLIAPYLERGLRISWKGDRLSEPYVRMTMRLMRQFGAKVKVHDEAIEVMPGAYSIERTTIPRDRSAAAFWYEVVAFSKGSGVKLIGVYDDGIQGDSIAEELWSPWVISEQQEDGLMLMHRSSSFAAEELNIDLKDSPDLFQPLIFTCAGSGASLRCTGLRNLSMKESDRLKATAEALRVLGRECAFTTDSFTIPKGPVLQVGHRSSIIDPQEDHRLAMSAAPVALVAGSLRIADPDVVVKSYPLFWDHLEMAGFKLQRSS